MRRGKYNVAPKAKRTYKGKVYASTLEMDYRKHLDLLKKAKGNDRVLEIEEQVVFPFEYNGVKICKYILDYKVTYPDRVEYVDTKGIKGGTDVFMIKSKLMLAFYGIKIKEVYRGDF